MKKLSLIPLIVILLVLAVSITVQGQVPPVHDGEFAVPGLNDTVEIFRDEWGVPHIYASNTHDLLFAQGYTQAQDRWWQMEFSRHTGSGTLQELTGRNEALMGTDLYLRTLGFREVAERELVESYNEDDIALLQSFADGINAYIMGKDPGQLAFEYTALGMIGVTVEIKPWSLVDTMVWMKVMSYGLGGNQGSESRLAKLAAGLDSELLEDWNVAWPFGEKPTIIWPEDLPVTTETAAINNSQDAGIVGLDIDLIGGFEAVDLSFGSGPGIGSNNWVVDGNLTESGLPLMANDPHLGLEMPSIWYEIGLHCMPVSDECPYDVTGFTFTSFPLVVLGHNSRISWAFTNVGPDTQDLYQIRVNPDNPLQYEWNEEWRDMTVREETLNFGDGSESIDFQVRVTHLGPIINDSVDGFNNESPIAMRWAALDTEQTMRSLALLNRAQNWNDFREALSYFDSPSQNILYADVDGNIGYQTPGRIPIRAPGHTGLLPVPGWTDEYEWLGYIPYDMLPRIYNPARGYVSTANQALVPLEYYAWLAEELGDEFGADAHYVISYQWDFGYRGERINYLLEELAPHNADTFGQIHSDNYDGSAAEIMPFLAELEIEDTELAAARDWLVEWDYQFNMDSPQAPLYAFFWTRLMDNLYNDQFGDLDKAGGSQNEWRATYLLMQEPDNAWWDDFATDGVTESRDEIMLLSFGEGYAATVEALGENRDEWQWGTLHTITFVSSPIGQSGIGPVENMVNRGPVAVGGTGSAINAMSWSAASDGFTTSHGPSMRAIYDLSDWDNSLTIHPTGQSGHPISFQYESMIEPWRNIEYHPMLWSRENVEAAAVSTLTLTPGE